MKNLTVITEKLINSTIELINNNALSGDCLKHFYITEKDEVDYTLSSQKPESTFLSVKDEVSYREIESGVKDIVEIYY